MEEVTPLPVVPRKPDVPEGLETFEVHCGILPQALSTKWPVNWRRCMFMFHVGQEAWACATANCVANDQLSRRLATFR